MPPGGRKARRSRSRSGVPRRAGRRPRRLARPLREGGRLPGSPVGREHGPRLQPASGTSVGRSTYESRHATVQLPSGTVEAWALAFRDLPKTPGHRTIILRAGGRSCRESEPRPSDVLSQGIEDADQIRAVAPRQRTAVPVLEDVAHSATPSPAPSRLTIPALLCTSTAHRLPCRFPNNLAERPQIATRASRPSSFPTPRPLHLWPLTNLAEVYRGTLIAKVTALAQWQEVSREKRTRTALGFR